MNAVTALPCSAISTSRWACRLPSSAFICSMATSAVIFSRSAALSASRLEPRHQPSSRPDEANFSAEADDPGEHQRRLPTGPVVTRRSATLSAPSAIASQA